MERVTATRPHSLIDRPRGRDGWRFTRGRAGPVLPAALIGLGLVAGTVQAGADETRGTTESKFYELSINLRNRPGPAGVEYFL
jgi:hypothetical protein